MSELILENNLSNNMTNEIQQKNFIETNIGKAINTGLNIGIRYLLPDLIENEVINVKDSFLQNGFREGIQTAIDSALNLGKSILGIFTGKFENVNQIQNVLKTGGIIDSVSNVVNHTVDKIVDSGKLNYNIGNVLKKGKNILLNNITQNIENEFENQINNIEKLNKYTENWKECFNKKDFDGMQREYEKIVIKTKEVAPIEKTIQMAKTIENLHKLIKNNGQKFNLTQEQLELAQML